MITFLKNEIISSTTFVRQFSTFLNLISKKTLKKIAIIRNNEMEAVIISIDEYERLKNLENTKFTNKSPKNYFGSMSSDDFEIMENALKDCRKVDLNEW